MSRSRILGTELPAALVALAVPVMAAEGDSVRADLMKGRG